MSDGEVFDGLGGEGIVMVMMMIRVRRCSSMVCVFCVEGEEVLGSRDFSVGGDE